MIPLATPGYYERPCEDHVEIVTEAGHVARGPGGHPLVFGLGVTRRTLERAAEDHKRRLVALVENLDLLLGRERWTVGPEAVEEAR